MKTVFFDIETIPCQLPGALEEFKAAVTAPAQYKKADSIAAWMDENRDSEGEAAWLKTSFDGGMGHVCAIALAEDDQNPVVYYFPEQWTPEAERLILEWFFSHLTDIGHCKLVGHNHIGFDIPFLWKRAMVLNMKPPFNFPRNPKPWSEAVADTMLLWDATQRAGGSMDRICRLMGIPGKGDVSGADVWPMVKAGRIVEVAEYCKADVERTRAMYRRMTFSEAA